ncbi:uncharacterized protein BT62DRAFT_1007191 [Guyanagaster necrorhizus]|uniref:Uncharacterized protein n=1 Tax=Guyanagaster necrorhizus TaxID=856835 RepID=A0A9P7VRT9_9AGAR|nr:uncharacterized protein BT62DRAFT_1007191 [Guyanagaster necrorhizus MCA 3950]KAG7445437.1 hypothetical protein BT62DRAFT_1007191 [Guyanagaster necrorhizus MCA 3950]
MTRELTSALQHLTSAPTFSSLAVAGISIFRCLDDPYCIPWAGLTELTLNNLSYISTCLALLALCPLLERCTISVDGAAFHRLDPSTEQHVRPHQPPGHTIAQPRLAALALTLSGDVLPALFAAPLHAPALCSLTLSINLLSGPTPTWPHAAFAAWLTRAQCTLERITLRRTGMQGSEFYSCLALPAFTGVRELTVQELTPREAGWFPAGSVECISRDALAALTVRGGGEGGCVLLPKLEVLVLQGWCVEGGGGAALVEMVRSRRRAGGGGGVQLRKFSWSRMADYDYLDIGDPCTLKMLMEGGLDTGEKNLAAAVNVDFCSDICVSLWDLISTPF